MSLHLQVIPSERPGHALIENWNPLGVIGKNHILFELLVTLGFRDHHCLQLPCGCLRLELRPGHVLRQHDGVEGRPHHSPHLHRHHQVGEDLYTWHQVPRCVADVLERNSLPGAVSTLCQVREQRLCFWTLATNKPKGGTDVGVEMANDKRVKLVSFTGSTQVVLHFCSDQF